MHSLRVSKNDRKRVLGAVLRRGREGWLTQTSGVPSFAFLPPFSLKFVAAPALTQPSTTYSTALALASWS
jgi:hypothetical protein